MNDKKIEVVPYNPAWPTMFEQEASLIRGALGEDLLNIYHVGSTSVPNLAAKPKIDIIAEAKDLAFDDSNLLALEYNYRGGFSIPLRKTYTNRTRVSNTNLHIFEKNDPEIKLNLLFRDYLRNNQDVREKYQALKCQLILDDASHVKNGEMYVGYTLGKHDLITSILKEAGFKGFRFIICSHYSEIEAAKNFRTKYFLDNNQLNDPYEETFNYHPDHKHLVLYSDMEIIAYTHLQLLPEKKAMIHMLVFDDTKRKSDLSGDFLNLIKKWLKLSGTSILDCR